MERTPGVRFKGLLLVVQDQLRELERPTPVAPRLRDEREFSELPAVLAGTHVVRKIRLHNPQTEGSAFSNGVAVLVGNRRIPAY